MMPDEMFCLDEVGWRVGRGLALGSKDLVPLFFYFVDVWGLGISVNC